MALLPNTFNVSQSEKLGDFSAIPAGDYLAHIKASAMKETKSGEGQYLQLTFEILEGEHRGRNIFVRLNLVNPSVTAVQIAQKTLASIGECAGVPVITDSEELHGKPMYITLQVKEKTAQYPESNEVRGYKPAIGAAPVSVPSGTKAAATPPWKR